MTQLGFSMDADACMGCKVCIAACKDVHDTPVGLARRKVLTAEAGGWHRDGQGQPVQDDVFAFSVSVSCNHCDRPVCVMACKNKALRKDEATGLVLVDESACTGCGICAKACPYDAISIDAASRKALKCDGCIDLLEAGEQPACVTSCLMRCLEFGPMERLRSLAEAGHPGLTVSSDNAVLPPSNRTSPNLVLVAHRKDKGLGKGEVRVAGRPKDDGKGRR